MLPWARKGRVQALTKGFVLVAVLLIVYAFWRFQGGFVSGFLFYAVSGLLVYELYVYGLALRGLQVSRLMNPKPYVAGESLEVVVEIKRPFPTPFIWLYVEDGIPNHLRSHRRQSAAVMLPWFERTSKVVYRLDAVPRGVYRFEQVMLTAGDLFGFLSLRKVFPETDELLVYPRVQSIRHWPIRDLYHMEGDAGRRHLTEEPVTVSGIRDFTPGDRLQRIHWKATARSMSFKSKEFEFRESRNIVFFLDLYRGSFHHGQFGDPLLERAVSLTLSLAAYTIAQGLPAGLLAQTDKPVRVAPACGEVHLSLFKDRLARVEAKGAFALEKLVEQERPRFEGGAFLVIVTPKLQGPLVHLLCSLSLGQCRVVLFWLREQAPTERQQAWVKQLAECGAKVVPIAGSSFQRVFEAGRHIS